jgi:CubicO group peptidase (beta-lactamase class C family)
VELQLRRWHMLDADQSAVSFRSMDTLYPLANVARGGPVWELPRAERPLDFTYSWQGQAVPASQFAERTLTNALLIIKDGRIVSETYRNGSTAASRFAGWSISKSITSVLFGCALADGSIASLNTPITQFLPELANSGYANATILDVMEMRSGVAYDESYDFSVPSVATTNHVQALIKYTARFADVASTLPSRYAPGSVFEYKTIDTAVLGWLIERATQEGLGTYTSRCLWQPLGAEADAFYILDGAPGVGRAFNGAGFNATLRDYGRFGQMMLGLGVADGRRIVSEDWVRQSTQPRRPEDPATGGYGLQWWTMAGSDAFAAIGLQGQYIYVEPVSRTVIVKLSHFPPGDNSAREAETMAFMSAAASWAPPP